MLVSADNWEATQDVQIEVKGLGNRGHAVLTRDMTICCSQQWNLCRSTLASALNSVYSAAFPK